MIVNMLQNLSHMYSSHYRIIKYVSFKPIHYAINLNAASSFKVFKFDSVFETIKLSLFQKNKKRKNYS